MAFKVSSTSSKKKYSYLKYFWLLYDIATFKLKRGDTKLFLIEKDSKNERIRERERGVPYNMWPSSFFDFDGIKKNRKKIENVCHIIIIFIIIIIIAVVLDRLSITIYFVNKLLFVLYLKVLLINCNMLFLHVNKHRFFLLFLIIKNIAR